MNTLGIQKGSGNVLNQSFQLKQRNCRMVLPTIMYILSKNAASTFATAVYELKKKAIPLTNFVWRTPRIFNMRTRKRFYFKYISKHVQKRNSL